MSCLVEFSLSQGDLQELGEEEIVREDARPGEERLVSHNILSKNEPFFFFSQYDVQARFGRP